MRDGCRAPHRIGAGDWIWWAAVIVIASLLTTVGVRPARSETTAKRTNPTILIRPAPDDMREATVLFETDEFNTASLCAKGIVVSKDHRSRSCRLGRSRSLDVATTFGGTTLTLFATRSSYDSDGGYGLREEVIVVDEKAHPIHTLVQWRHDVYDEESKTLRRRFRLVNVDREGEDELCVQSTTTMGPGRFDTAAVYRPIRRHTGYDAFTWSNDRFARAESLDGECPTIGYQMFVAMPVTEDPVHRSRDR